MSKYTTQVRYICENYAGLNESSDYNGVNAVIKKAIPKVFDFDYPIYDLNYKSVLETKILKHYYTREIGLETVALWKLKLDTKLNEIMPYYNELYKSTLLEFNPLYDIDLMTNYTLIKDQSGGETQNISDNNTRNLTHEENKSNLAEENLSGTEIHTGDKTAKENNKFSENSETSGGSDLSRSEETEGTISGETVRNEDGLTESETDVNNEITKSDFPQGSIQDLRSGNYLTSGEIQKNKTESSSKNENKLDESVNSESKAETITNETLNNQSEVNSSGNTEKDLTEEENRNVTNNSKSTITGNELSNLSSNEQINKSVLATSNRNLNTIDDYIHSVRGKTGGKSYASAVMEFRQSFLNIDMMIIKDLSELFMNIW